MLQCTNFENLPVFDEVMCRLRWLTFFGPPCINIVAKAKQRSSQILRFFLGKDPEVLTKAFVVYVRPILEYSSPVWSPSTVTWINKLESVQRSFTKRLPGLHKLSYETRLKRLGLERLEIRRLHADLSLLCVSKLSITWLTLHLIIFFKIKSAQEYTWSLSKVVLS